MTSNYSAQVNVALVVTELAPFIVKAIQAAFQRVSEGSDELNLGTQYAKAVDGVMAYYTVQEEMEKLHGELPGLVVERKPNRSKSAFHAELRYKGLVLTFASAQDEDAMPRWAGFRQDLLQGRFDIGESGDMEITSGGPDEIYVQGVYGRKGLELTFIKAVCVTLPDHNVLFLHRAEREDRSGPTVTPETEQIDERDWFNDEGEE